MATLRQVTLSVCDAEWVGVGGDGLLSQVTVSPQTCQQWPFVSNPAVMMV